MKTRTPNNRDDARHALGVVPESILRVAAVAWEIASARLNSRSGRCYLLVSFGLRS